MQRPPGGAGGNQSCGSSGEGRGSRPPSAAGRAAIYNPGSGYLRPSAGRWHRCHPPRTNSLCAPACRPGSRMLTRRQPCGPRAGPATCELGVRVGGQGRGGARCLFGQEVLTVQGTQPGPAHRVPASQPGCPTPLPGMGGVTGDPPPRIPPGQPLPLKPRRALTVPRSQATLAAPQFPAGGTHPDARIPDQQPPRKPPDTVC